MRHHFVTVDPSLSMTPDAFSDPEQLLAAFFHSPNVGIAVFDRKLRYQAINDALAAMNGVPPVEHLGHTVREVLGEFAAKIEPAFRRAERGETLLNFQIEGALPTRRETGYWVENYFPIRDHAGRVRQIGVIVIEITSQKKLENVLRRLTEALRQREQLGSGVAAGNGDHGGASARGTLRDVEREYILKVLKETRGVVAGPRGAAVRLGLKRTTLQSKMQRLKIVRSEYGCGDGPKSAPASRRIA
jgi:PAS domain S-box-containing protein